MPINQHLMDNLLKEYGPKKGKDVYYGMEQKAKIKAKIAAKKKK